MYCNTNKTRLDDLQNLRLMLIKGINNIDVRLSILTQN